MYQVGRTNANGTPVAREARALDDIQGSIGIRPQFIDYNSPVVTGEFAPVPMVEPMPQRDSNRHTMSKQCRLFLLPADTERLLEDFRLKANVKVISRKSPSMKPVEMTSPFLEYFSHATSTKFVYLDCFLIPALSSEIRMHYLAKLDEWVVSESSEAVEFAGCDYDGKILRPGRLYFQTDQVLGDDVFPKRVEFLRWADQLLRITKGLFTKSPMLNAYVGTDAEDWERNGGRFEKM